MGRIQTQLEQALKQNHIFIQEPMKKHTTFRVGGPADILVTPDKEELPRVLQICREEKAEVTVIGNGSNLLVSDEGIRGVVVEIGACLSFIHVEKDRVTAGAGAMLSKAANTALEHGLSGMEFASGIPGSVGGAVVMNAGAYGGEIKDIILSAKVLSPEGDILELDKEALKLSYRHSCIPEENYVVLAGEFELEACDPGEIRARMQVLREQRQGKQPLEYPSAGSTFKRPEGYFAGKLIMDAGLKGVQIGGAQVSEKHCGFVINKGGATAQNVKDLIAHIQKTVYEKSGVRLEPEVKFIGHFL